MSDSDSNKRDCEAQELNEGASVVLDLADNDCEILLNEDQISSSEKEHPILAIASTHVTSIIRKKKVYECAFCHFEFD